MVYHHSRADVPIPLTVACPRCGKWDVVMVTTGAVRQAQGTWVLPLGHGAVPHQTPSDLPDPQP